MILRELFYFNKEGDDMTQDDHYDSDNDSSEIKKGDIVYYFNHSWQPQGKAVRCDQTMYILLQEYDVQLYINKH
mgnify:CR=1 FL=1